jgi:hypothetical protein
MSNLDLDDGREAERNRIIRSRNRVLALVLAGFVILVFAISIAKMG